MESFLKQLLAGKQGTESKRYFLRFGKGIYKKRFPISYAKGNNIKIRGGFEWANDFVEFVKENKDVLFSGNILNKTQVPGRKGRKKGSSFIYEIVNSKIEEFNDPYFYLLNCDDSDFVLRIKKSLPKPGKNEDKIDDKFCALEIHEKYWHKFKEAFFWDVPECKKAVIDHELHINDVEIPKDIKDSNKIRELAVRKGKIVRKINCDGKEESKEYKLEI